MADSDHTFLKELARVPDNTAMVAGLNIENPGFIPTLRREEWSTAMILLQDHTAVAAAAIAPADTQHQNGRLVVLAYEPRRWPIPLALYIRHAFWSHPLHRLYAIVPRSYTSQADLLQGCGFHNEGRLLSHVRAGMRMVDLDVFGLLRDEFDTWCRENQAGLVL